MIFLSAANFLGWFLRIWFSEPTLCMYILFPPSMLHYPHIINIKEPRFLVNDQRDAQIIFYAFISIYNSLHVSSTSCSSSGETNFINTASGNSHSMLVAEMCAGWKKSNLYTSLPPT